MVAPIPPILGYTYHPLVHAFTHNKPAIHLSKLCTTSRSCLWCSRRHWALSHVWQRQLWSGSGRVRLILLRCFVFLALSVSGMFVNLAAIFKPGSPRESTRTRDFAQIIKKPVRWWCCMLFVSICPVQVVCELYFIVGLSIWRWSTRLLNRWRFTPQIDVFVLATLLSSVCCLQWWWLCFGLRPWNQ